MLKPAASLFRTEARPKTRKLGVFVDANKDDVAERRTLGVECIYWAMLVEPSILYAANDLSPSARALSDPVLSGELYPLREKNTKVQGVR